MDEVDLGLLRSLLREPRASYERLGASVGLTPNAAKARLSKLRADGLLQGVLAAPDAATLGLREGLLVFSGVDDADDDTLANLCELTGVRFADAGLDGTVALWTYVRDEDDAERLERAAISLLGRPPSWRRLAVPKDAAPLTLPEWRAARSLVKDARLPLSDAADAADVTPKTFRRRLASMLATDRLHVGPVLSTSESASPLVETILVPASDADRASMRAALPATSLVGDGLAGALLVWTPGRTLRDARRAAAPLRAIPGVERSIATVSTRRAGSAWLDEVAHRALRPVAPVPIAPVPVIRSR